jgi:hypothetical protein
MVTFRVINNKVRPMGDVGVSSTSLLGTPARTPTVPQAQVGVLPKTSGGVSLGSGGIFGITHQVNRLLESANKKKEEAKSEIKEAQASKSARDSRVENEIAETSRNERLDQQSGNIKTLKDKLTELNKARTKKQKEKNEEKKQQVEEVLKKQEVLKWKTENYNLKGDSINALRFQAAVKGDRDAQRIIQAISRDDLKLAEKLIDERSKKFDRAIAEKSKEDNFETTEALKTLRFTPNNEGQWTPTDRTPEVASGLDIPITHQQNEVLKETPIQAPPKISATEVAILAQTDGGKERLRQWGLTV